MKRRLTATMRKLDLARATSFPSLPLFLFLSPTLFQRFPHVILFNVRPRLRLDSIIQIPFQPGLDFRPHPPHRTTIPPVPPEISLLPMISSCISIEVLPSTRCSIGNTIGLSKRPLSSPPPIPETQNRSSSFSNETRILEKVGVASCKIGKRGCALGGVLENSNIYPGSSSLREGTLLSIDDIYYSLWRCLFEWWIANDRLVGK